MDKKEKSEAVTAEKKEKHCCDKDCTCGCQEGKECTCGNGCKCGCSCCCKKTAVKLICALLLFLAGMGFHSLLQCGVRCPVKGPHPMPVRAMPVPPAPVPAYSDAQGGNIIIINTGDTDNTEHFLGKHADKKFGCHEKKHHHKKHHSDKMKDDKTKADRMRPEVNMPVMQEPDRMAPLHSSAAVK